MRKLLLVASMAAAAGLATHAEAQSPAVQPPPVDDRAGARRLRGIVELERRHCRARHARIPGDRRRQPTAWRRRRCWQRLRRRESDRVSGDLWSAIPTAVPSSPRQRMAIPMSGLWSMSRASCLMPARSSLDLSARFPGSTPRRCAGSGRVAGRWPGPLHRVGEVSRAVRGGSCQSRRQP